MLAIIMTSPLKCAVAGFNCIFFLCEEVDFLYHFFFLLFFSFPFLSLCVPYTIFQWPIDEVREEQICVEPRSCRDDNLMTSLLSKGSASVTAILPSDSNIHCSVTSSSSSSASSAAAAAASSSSYK